MLIAAALLIAIVIVTVVIRRRGRKVFIKDTYVDNYDRIYVFSKDFDSSTWYQGRLKYVMIPYNYERDIFINAENRNEPTGILINEYVPVIAIGEEMPNGKVKTVRLNGGGYIGKQFLNI